MNEDWTRFRDPRDQEKITKRGNFLIAGDGAEYPIVENIPRFVPNDNYAADFGRQWKRFHATQLDSHTGIPLSEERLQQCIGGNLGVLAGRRVLEVGSGAGRFTEILLKSGAVLDSCDFSDAVTANALNNSAKEFCLAQADIDALPFPKASYDFVICLGVLQHTPSTERSIEKLWEMVAPGGRLAIDHYRWNLWKVLPPPLGDAEKLYRRIALALPAAKRESFVNALVEFWFPIYWKTRRSKIMRKILGRTAGIHFYYGEKDLRTRERFYEWSLLDTHDGMTDHFKRFRTCAQIERTLRQLGAVELNVRRGGNGVEAIAMKPPSQDAA